MKIEYSKEVDAHEKIDKLDWLNIGKELTSAA